MPKIIFGLAPIATSISIVSFGVISATRNSNKGLKYLFAALCGSVGLWAFFYGLMYLADPQNSLVYARIGYVGVVFIPTFTLHFTLRFLGQKKKTLLYLAYLTSFLFLPITQSEKFMSGYYLYAWGAYPKAGPLYILWVIFFMSIFLCCEIFLFKYLKNSDSKNPILYNQVKFVFLAFAVATTSIVDYIPNYGIEIYPFAYLSAFGWISLMAYATLKYRLMDFNLIMRWGIAYFVLVLVLIAAITPLMLVTEYFSRSYLHFNPGFSTVLAASILVFAFDPMRKIITKFVDQIIFKSPDFQALLIGIEESIANAKTIFELSSQLSDKLKTIWTAAHTGIAVWDFKNACYQLLPEKEFHNQIISKLNESIKKSDFLVRTLESEKRLFWNGIVIEEEVTNHGSRSLPGERTTFWKIRRTMRWIGASACVPLIWKKELLGFIILGPKRNSSIYNDEDKKFLSHLAEKITVAVKNLVTTDFNTATNYVRDA